MRRGTFGKRPSPERQAQLIAELRRSKEQRVESYRERALKLFPHVCGRCGREFEGDRLRELTVHHKDHNHNNNPPDGRNWELLCVYCHDDEHEKLLKKGYGTGASDSSPAPAKSSLANPFDALDALTASANAGAVVEPVLERFLDDLERRIDAAGEDALLEQWRTFCDGGFQGDIFAPRREYRAAPSIEWPRVLVNEALDDVDAMILQQLGDCSAELAQGGGRLMAVRANYGTGILPTVFGSELFRMDSASDTLPTAKPLPGGKAAMQALLERGIPDPRGGLGADVFAAGRRMREAFAPYPNIRRYVHIYHPDLQGPMDVCELLWGSALFVDVVDEPELVHAVLDLITRTYTAFLRAWDDALAAPPAPYAVHWSLLHRGHIMLRDDSAMNFSPEMFEAFIEPYDARLLTTFGGGAIHFCGRGSHYIHRIGQMPGAFAVNLSQPECNDMETVFANTVDRGIALIGLRREAAEAALARGRKLHGRVHCG